MSASSFFSGCFAYGVVLIGLLVLAKRRDVIAASFFFFSINAGGWGLGFSYWISQLYSFETTLLIARISHFFSSYIPIAWLHFSFVFIKKKEPFPYFYAFVYTLSAALSITSVTSDLYISGLHKILNFKYYVSPGPVYHVFALVFFTLVPYGFYSLWKFTRQAPSGKLIPVKLLFYGSLCAFSAGSVTFFCVYKIPAPLSPLVLLLAYPLLMGIALIKYGLFDVQEIADAFQREKMAAVGMLAASLNHELRNNLYVAKGRVEIYKDGVERNVYATPESRLGAAEKAIEIISGQIESMGGIIRRFTDFAKPFNTRKDKQKFRVAELLSEVREMVTFELQSSNVRLEDSVPEGISLFANRRQLEEVLMNLILNACQAIKLGRQESGADISKEGEIRISAEEKAGKVKIAVADNGPGMDRDRVERIFEPFFTTKQEGTGLGLYITKQLVEKNGGKISVQSSCGKGTIFYLTFNPISAESRGVK